MGGRPRSTPHRVLAVLALPLLAGGCDTKAELMPLEEAKFQVPKPVVEPLVRVAPEPGQEPLAGPPTALPGAVRPQTVEFAGRIWQASATEYELPASAVRPVATVRELQLYALAWDEEPYDRLLLAGDGRWRELLDIY